MKKFRLVAILLAVMTLLTLALTACNNTTTITRTLRWNTDETTTYNISLTRAAGKSDAITTQLDDVLFTVHFPTTPLEYDRAVPSNVTGTYTTTLVINQTEGTATYSTTQVVTETFNSTNYYFTFARDLYNNCSEEMRGKLNASLTNDAACFTSTIDTTVTFANDDKQTPIYSSQTICGFYIGMQHQETNDVKFETNYENGVATVTKNGEPLYETEVGPAVFDSLQIPLIARTLDQSKDTTGGSYVAPQIAVYNFKEDTTTNLTFTVVPNHNVQLNNTDGEFFATTSVVLVGASNYMGRLFAFVSNPKSTMRTDFGQVNTYEQVMFQSEYYVYEIAGYSSQQVDQLKYVPATTPEEN